jgi:hypothetical protein
MRLRRRDLRVKVNLQAGDHPIVLGLGFCTLEASTAEARQLALDLIDGIATLQRGGGQC